MEEPRDRTQWTPSLQLLTRYAQDRGVEIGPILQTYGLDTDPWPERISLASYGAILERLDDAITLPLWPMDAGAAADSENFGVFGYALATAPSIEASIDLFIRYSTTWSEDATLYFDRHAGQINHGTTGSSTDRVRELRAQLFTGATAAWLERLGAPAKRIHFRQPNRDPARARAIEWRLKADLVFESSLGDVVELPAALIKRAPPLSNASVHAFITQRLDSLSQNLRPIARLSEHIRHLLSSGIGMSNMAVHTVARALRISERTMQRRLQEEQLTWSDVFDQARHELALKLLRDGLGTKVIAERLGYSEPRAFFRAFRRWTGKSPAEWRQTQDDQVGH